LHEAEAIVANLALTAKTPASSSFGAPSASRPRATPVRRQ
jgi:hypothetical protein